MTAALAPPSRRIVLVENPRGGHAGDRQARAHASLARERLTVVDTVSVQEIDRLRDWVRRPSAERPLVVVAGGDGTIGTVVDYVVNSDAVLGILPLGTSNDVARSLKIPMRIEEAVHLLAAGKVATVDVGEFIAKDRRHAFFMHAAALGLNVAFARIATQASFRKRLGKLTYALAGLLAMRRREHFACELQVDDDPVRHLTLLHLSVINAPVFGGFFGLRVPGSDVDDRRIDVVAIEDMPTPRLLMAGLWLALGRAHTVRGLQTFHARRLHIHADTPLELSLDGEVSAQIPGDFVVAADALRVITPQHFVDVDD
jgi:YegS/Rv2252/BmrU family lipid kinase